MSSGAILVFGKAIIWIGIPLVLMVREVVLVRRLQREARATAQKGGETTDG